jgi:hypothetical protein
MQLPFRESTPPKNNAYSYNRQPAAAGGPIVIDIYFACVIRIFLYSIGP